MVSDGHNGTHPHVNDWTNMARHSLDITSDYQRDLNELQVRLTGVIESSKHAKHRAFPSLRTLARNASAHIIESEKYNVIL